MLIKVFIRRRLARLAILTLISMLATAIYLAYFKRPPTDVLLKMNRKSQFNLDPRPDAGDKVDVDEVDNADVWTRFLHENHFVAVGALFDRCDGQRTQLGTVVLMEDKERGGVMTKTFVNMTVEKDINGGQFHVDIKYNGQELYTNYWELCELEQELPEANKTFTCPIRQGLISKVKVKHIMDYLPAGRYQTKGWALDESNEEIICGFADFVL
ncbi:uncharacterized protein LOC131953253 [Physella acuta]|uniref:uncharacterized protein LOC131953253 n=1 Tax=Physella acuta TaxID=109671 RepID=UPI0027DBA950|nr:uncharacterized protein LOC131953253 [Physella acuta]